MKCLQFFDIDDTLPPAPVPGAADARLAGSSSGRSTTTSRSTTRTTPPTNRTWHERPAAPAPIVPSRLAGPGRRGPRRRGRTRRLHEQQPRGKPAAPAAASPTTSAATSSPARPAPPAKNPLTGIGPVPKTPLIAVKIDDTAPGRPQVGIDKADIVYIEAVEAGYTRLAAIFGTNKPTVGYVRSTRPERPGPAPAVRQDHRGLLRRRSTSRCNLRKKAGLTSWSNDAGAAGFYRVNRSESTYINLVLNLAVVAKKTHTPAADVERLDVQPEHRAGCRRRSRTASARWSPGPTTTAPRCSSSTTRS